MPINQLTDLKLKKAKPRQRDYMLGDGGGVFLRVKPNGSKSWVFIYSLDGRRRWKGMGIYPSVGLSKAREIAGGYRLQITSGTDPTDAQKAAAEEQRMEKRRKAARTTVRMLFEDWQKRELAVRRKDNGESARQLLEKYAFKSLGDRFADEITKRDIQGCMDGASELGFRRSANVLRAVFRQMFDYALDREIITADPTARIRKVEGGDSERDRVLSLDEIRELSSKLPESGLSPQFQAAVWILLATMARVGELSAARWAEVDIEAGTWIIPAANAKNKKTHVVNLSEFARKQFENLPRLKDSEGKAIEWIFPGRDKSAPIGRQTITKELRDRQRKKRIKGRSTKIGALSLNSGAGSWTAHDLRRTGATLMGELGVRSDVIDRCLNHVEQSKVTRTYQRQELLEDRRKAFDTLGLRLTDLQAAEPEKVAIFKTRKRL